MNYKRLRYFWMVVREGTLRRAAERLHVSEPAVSIQLKKLQEWMKEPLFRKEGRRLVLTELGQVVFQYADQIFALGDELTDVVRGRAEGQSARIRIGLTETIPKMLAAKLLAPAFDVGDSRLEVVEAPLEAMVDDLALHKLELVLSDKGAPEDPSHQVFAHRLGRCDVSILGTPALAESVGESPEVGFERVPWLLPAKESPVRRDLEGWFAVEGLRPRIVAEFQDSALLKAFGAEGRGLIAVPSFVENDVCRQYGLVPIYTLPGVEETFYALTVERKISHPGVRAILDSAAALAFEDRDRSTGP